MTFYKLGHVVGEKGEKGDPGEKGAKGDTGPQGPKGDPGEVNIVTSWESTLSDSKVASEKLVKNTIDTKQATLVSGTNIKTINNNSLLGSGNINIGGGGGGVDIVTSWSSTLSDEKVPSEKLTKNSLDDKVDKVTGKGLSTEDYTSTEKSKLSGIESEANKYVHPTTKQCSYAPDLTNYIQKSSTSGLIKNDGSVDTTAYATSQTIVNYATANLVAKTDIVDNLNSSDSTKVLSAKQGKALADLIGDAITYINQ